LPTGETHSSAKSVDSSAESGRAAGAGRRARRAKARKRRFTAKELEGFRQALLDKRRELIGDVTHLGNSTRSQARQRDDDAAGGWELEFSFVAIENKQSLLRDIDDALRRIEDRTYGFCLATNKAISMSRLRIMPWAKYCLEHARWRESGR
jgi:DnaK suppressor protein